ncbi:MAG: iron-sulfur cluster carrier protein ApbC [Steroidobacteraceae bacterium]|jgi:ATP-binding protein involved in chromosome partitioning|nr:iron-sulfur cluster carrier protein ApbC [Steroidobacteraceae bacterium]
MAAPDETALAAGLAGFVDPASGVNLGTLEAVQRAVIEGGRARVALRYGFPTGGYAHELQPLLAAHLGAAGVREPLDLEVSSDIRARAVQRQLKPMSGIANVVAVASGKGGVGKSTVAVNLALAWAAQGARVGVLDADIYGPSQPLMLGIAGQRPQVKEGKRIQPIASHGIVAMSIGFLIDESQPMVWRGPMVTQALTQLLGDTDWGQLDYLVVDMPPGTGDIQLTLAQKVPVAGAVIVTTPQHIAVADARKGLKMFEKVSVPVLGIVENMSLHVCSNCGHAEAIFGEGGGEEMTREYGVALLGRLPLDARIREETDGGRPTVAAAPDSPRAAAYLAMARRTAAALALRERASGGAFPQIVVEAT